MFNVFNKPAKQSILDLVSGPKVVVLSQQVQHACEQSHSLVNKHLKWTGGLGADAPVRTSKTICRTRKLGVCSGWARRTSFPVVALKEPGPAVLTLGCPRMQCVGSRGAFDTGASTSRTENPNRTLVTLSPVAVCFLARGTFPASAARIENTWMPDPL